MGIDKYLENYYSKLRDKNYMKNTQSLIVLVLVIAAIGMGGFIVKETFFKSPSPAVQTTPPSQQTNQTNTNTQQANIVEQIKFPPANATEAQIAEFNTQVSTSAKETNTLSISNCQATPYVVRVKYLSSLSITNTDQADHRIRFDDAHEYELPAGKTTSVKVDFGGTTSKAGIYSFECYTTGKPIVWMGIVQVME